MMPSVRCRLSAVLLLALCWSQGPAKAGDLEDCTGTVIAKIEPACTAIIDDQSRPADDRLKAYVVRSRLSISRAKYDLAMADADAAVQLNPKFVPALLARAFVYERTAKFDLALTDLNQAIEIDPKNPIAYITRGNVKADQKNWADSLQDLDQAIALRQDIPQAYVGRGRAYVET